MSMCRCVRWSRRRCRWGAGGEGAGFVGAGAVVGGGWPSRLIRMFWCTDWPHRWQASSHRVCVVHKIPIQLGHCGSWLASDGANCITTFLQAHPRFLPCLKHCLLQLFKDTQCYAAPTYKSLRRCLRLRQNPPACAPRACCVTWIGSLIPSDRV